MGAGNRGLHQRHPPLTVLVDVLADHYGVINDDAQGYDKGKHRNHINRDIEHRQKQKATQKRNWDTHSDPEGQSKLQEQPQQHDDNCQPQEGVLQKQFQTLAIYL